MFAVAITESTSNANAQTSTPPSNNNVIPEDVAIHQVNDGFDTIAVNTATTTTLETNNSAAPVVNNNTITNATSATNTTIADLITPQKQKTVSYIEMSCILFLFYSLY